MMSENDKKLEEMFGAHAPGPSDHAAADREEYAKVSEKKKRPPKKKKAASPTPQSELDERDYRPIRKGREMRIGCLGGLMYFVFVVSVSIILACLGWMAASDVLALNKPGVSTVVTLEDSIFTEQQIETTDADGNPTTKIVTVADMDYVADQLKAEGLIEYKSLFKLYCKFSHADQKLDPGSYELSTDFDYRALIKKMNQGSGAAVTVDVMFPEGYSMRQIFEKLAENKVSSYDDLMKAAADFSYNYSFLNPDDAGDANRLEGYLFPDTYTFFVYMEPSSAIAKFLDNYNRKITDEMEAKAGEMGYTMDEIITIASMIEKEAANDAERPKIASVIYNRLAAGMPLQIDATTEYAMALAGRGDEKDTDYNIDSPYNTYKYLGLPVGPICNPGIASIEAALNPESTQYYYYALDMETKEHRFFSDLASHEQFVATQNYG